MERAGVMFEIVSIDDVPKADRNHPRIATLRKLAPGEAFFEPLAGQKSVLALQQQCVSSWRGAGFPRGMFHTRQDKTRNGVWVYRDRNETTAQLGLGSAGACADG